MVSAEINDSGTAQNTTKPPVLRWSDWSAGNDALRFLVESSPVGSAIQQAAAAIGQQCGSPAQAVTALQAAGQALAVNTAAARRQHARLLQQVQQTKAAQVRWELLQALSG